MLHPDRFELVGWEFLHYRYVKRLAEIDDRAIRIRFSRWSDSLAKKSHGFTRDLAITQWPYAGTRTRAALLPYPRSELSIKGVCWKPEAVPQGEDYLSGVATVAQGCIDRLRVCDQAKGGWA